MSDEESLEATYDAFQELNAYAKKNVNPKNLTDDEAALYDRQIRLWGLKSQKRLRAANILLVGLSGFGAEIAKNIILAGVKSVTFLDHRPVTELDTCCQFLIPPTEIGKNRAEASVERAKNLNPMVTVIPDRENVDDKADEFFKDFDVICISECTIEQIKKINDICRKYYKKFLVGDVFGAFGYMFSDLGAHEFAEELTHTKKIKFTEDGIEKERTEKMTVTVKSYDSFVPFEKVLEAKNVPKGTEAFYLMLILLNFRAKHKRNPCPSDRNSSLIEDEAKLIIEKFSLNVKLDHLLNENLYGQISPICAIVGGVMAQEIIKIVSKRDQPNNNLFIFNPDTLCGQIIKFE